MRSRARLSKYPPGAFMSFIKQCLWVTVIFAATAPFTANAQDQAPKKSDQKSAATTADATQAKAAFQAKFEEYKSAIREIEKLQAEFQTADSERRGNSTRK